MKRSETFPSKFDWRDYGKVTPVLDQNPCGTCWAFAAAGMLDSAALIAGYDLKENISPQQLLDCIDESLLDKKYGKKSACHGGGNIAFASEYLSSTDRRYTISQYPVYKQEYFTRECAIDKIEKDPILIKLQHSIWGNNIEQEMKELITNVGPIGGYVYASKAWKNIKGVGVLTKELCDAPLMEYNHAIMVVGWNDEYEYNGKKFKVWIVKNSWGTSGGDVFLNFLDFFHFLGRVLLHRDGSKCMQH